MRNDADSLRARILERHASIHAFCRAHPELKRSTVYLVLSGRYPGNWNSQSARILAALDDRPKREVHAIMPTMTRETLVEILQQIRCAHCRRLDRRECMACRDQTEREGKELFIRLFQEK